MAEEKKNLNRQIIIEGDPGFVCECDAYSEYMEITPYCWKNVKNAVWNRY